MIKTTLLSLSNEGLENVEVGGVQAYLNQNGYKAESVYLDGNKSIDKQFACLDLKSKIFGMFIYAESSVSPESLLGFSKLANSIKKKATDSIIIFISKFPSIYYKELLADERFSNIDYIILGESEYTLSSIIDCLEEGGDIEKFVSTHKHIASKTSINGKEILNIDINELPLPDRSYIKNKNFKNYYAFIYDSHGCTMKCSFCTRGQFYKFSGRSAESLFTEIKSIYDESPIRCFWFTGGSGGSFEDPGGKAGIKKIRDFCQLVIESGMKISLRCYLRSNFVAKVNTELFYLMKKAGFHVALVGIESGNEDDLKLLRKDTTVENNRITLKKLREAGLYADHIGFMMLNPYSTPERLQANYRFLAEQQPHDLDNYVHHLVVDPGTEIMSKIKEDGLLISGGDFFKGGLSYHFINTFAEEVSSFLHKYFLIYDTETANTATFIFNLAPLLAQGEEFEKRTYQLMRKRAKIYSEYFYNLYLSMDIGLCEREYPEFKAILDDFDRQLVLLKNSLIRELVRNKIM